MAKDTSLVHADTVRAATSSSGIDTVVTYTANDTIRYSLNSRTMYMYGNGNVRYKDLALKAEDINLNWTTSMLNASGVVDTADTTGKKLRGIPELIDGSETYHGDTIQYEFKSKKGRINLGKTQLDQGHYYGDEIKKVESNVLFVEDGKFTTCDLDHPHYYFGSPEMKVIVRDKIIARPVYLYIDDVPVLALPFGIFPSERGRRSGIIGPAFGESSRGRYLTHLGYYWAMNDYMDLAVRGDGYSKGSYTLYGSYAYKLLYFFEGSIDASFGRVVAGERGDPDYSLTKEFNLHFLHNQAIDPTTQFIVNFTFTSGSYYQNTSLNLNDLLQQNVVSNATLTKSWEGTGNSLTANIYRDQNLQTGQTSTVLPDVVFRVTQAFPFRSRTPGGTGLAQHWYDLIAYTYSGEFKDQQDKTPDSTGFTLSEHRGIQHLFTLNASPKLSYFTITPFFDYTEKWYDKRSEYPLIDTSANPVAYDVRAVKAVRYYNLGVTASTKLFGIFQPNVFGIKGIRHQVTPSITYTYAPDFSSSRWGYYGTYYDSNRVPHKYGFYGTQVFGGAPAGKQQAMSFNVGNVFEMKTVSTDSSGEDNKFQLLNLNAGISYNFAADSLRFSELSLNYRTSIAQLFTIGGSSSFNLYKFVPDTGAGLTGRRVNRFLINTDRRLADLTSFTISIGTRLSGEKKQTTAGPIISTADSLARVRRRGYVGLYDQEAPDFHIPWNLDLTWNFSRSQEDPRVSFISSGLSANLGFNLTEFWKINVATSYDLINRVFTASQVTVYRDLHCWELDFSWVPTGPYRNFKVEIRLKDPQLQDVKITKQGGARGIE